MSAPTAFDSLDLRQDLIANLDDLGYARMTLVQARALPHVLGGADVLARAKTGSGKTAAFGLGLLNKLDPACFQVQALVLCPTRELADQVAGEIRRLARAIPNVKVLSLCGGAPFRHQAGSLAHGAHIVVGTPGRVLNHLEKSTLNLDGLAILVLDEADRMLDMGFADQLNAIVDRVPAHRQTLLFSATYPPAIAAMSGRVLRQAVTVDVTDEEIPARINQRWCEVTGDHRAGDLLRALRAWGGELNLVFCHTREDCAGLAQILTSQGIAAVALHGDLDQARRDEMLVRFANRSASVLVATDVAARGLDVADVDAVFNYELPAQPEIYVHRIGRTGRAGKTGVAVSLVAQRELPRLLAIEQLLPGAGLRRAELPDTVAAGDRLTPSMTTLKIHGGRRNKLRPGDILGALTADDGVPADAVGSIDVLERCTYVAIRCPQADAARRQLGQRRIKGRQYRVGF